MIDITSGRRSPSVGIRTRTRAAGTTGRPVGFGGYCSGERSDIDSRLHRPTAVLRAGPATLAASPAIFVSSCLYLVSGALGFTCLRTWSQRPWQRSEAELLWKPAHREWQRVDRKHPMEPFPIARRTGHRPGRQSGLMMAGTRDVVHRSLAYSVLACFRIVMSGSASFQSARKAWYARFALALSPDEMYTLPSRKCASAPIGSSPTMPR